MRDPLSVVRPWITFSGCVLVVAVLYWAQTILIPIALAALITFVLAPLVTRLQSVVGRVPAVLAVVVLVFTVLGGAAWALTTQMGHLAADLPSYRANIRQKLTDIREARRGVAVEQVQATLQEIQSEVAEADQPKGTPAQPVVVQSQQVASLWGFPAWFGPLVGPLSTAGLVVALVIFMLLEREDLRGRLISVIGSGHLALTTKALDETGLRVSRQLLMQALVNGIYGVCVFIGLALIGVPYPLFWASLGAALRFIPYLGPVLAAGAPLLVALAALPGWYQPLLVAAMFVALELFTNLVLETVLYADAAGVSQVALLVAVAFWTWLWGPMGLLLATPLTVCLVVMGKHVPGLDFLSTLMADVSVLSPDVRYYQRLLAHDPGEAAEIIERYAQEYGPEAVYDGLMLPALNYAERDRLEGRLSEEDERSIVEGTRELMSDVMGRTTATIAPPPVPTPAGDVLRVLGFPVNSSSDTVALEMLRQTMAGEPVVIEIAAGHVLVSELAEAIRKARATVVCIADLPPSAPSRTRYIVKKLRAAVPNVAIVVGRWAPAGLSVDDPKTLTDAGANHVGLTMLETRNRLREYAVVPGVVTPTGTPTDAVLAAQ